MYCVLIFFYKNHYDTSKLYFIYIKKTSYITTPIYYVNDKPHIGHVYTNIIADCFHRIYSLLGYDVHLQTGTDEHGQKIQRTAEKNGVKPQEICDKYSEDFFSVFAYCNCAVSYEKFDANINYNNYKKSLEFTNDPSKKEVLYSNGYNFIRTTESGDGLNLSNEVGKRHAPVVKKIWTQLEQNGWIYKGNYSGFYAVRDECFYSESELVDGKAPTGAEVEFREEECYFFKLSKFQKVLLSIYSENSNSNGIYIHPKSRLKEVECFISGTKSFNNNTNSFEKISEGHLSDLCISRSKISWGIQVPTDPSHIIYVWVDALSNYLSGIGYDNHLNFEKYWKSCNDITHIVGKDILRFHCVYWPAFLIALQIKSEELDVILNDAKSNKKSIAQNIYSKVDGMLFNNVIAHGWWTKDKEKISKSLGNTINIYNEILWIMDSTEEDQSVAMDYFRYFLIQNMQIGSDGDYSRQALSSSINSHISNNFGNLVSRLFSMVKMYFPDGLSISDLNSKEYQELCSNLYQETYLSYKQTTKDKIMDSFINLFQDICNKANFEIDKSKPWKMAKDPSMKNELKNVLSYLICLVHIASIRIRPICPSISDKALNLIVPNFNSEDLNLKTKAKEICCFASQDILDFGKSNELMIGEYFIKKCIDQKVGINPSKVENENAACISKKFPIKDC